MDLIKELAGEFLAHISIETTIATKFELGFQDGKNAGVSLAWVY